MSKPPKTPAAAPLSEEAQKKLLALRERRSLEEIAGLVPCATATAYRAAAGGSLARPMRILLESRISELGGEHG